MNKLLFFLKGKIVYILVLLITFFVCTIELPYYIDAPGGLINVGARIDVEGKFESEGGINLAYVTEYSVNLPMLILSYFNKDWTLHKIETIEEKIDYEESFIRERLLMREAYGNAVFVAYQYAGKGIEVISSNVYVAYILDGSNTDLKVGDQIIEVDDYEIESKSDLKSLLSTKEVGDRLKIKVINEGKVYERFALIIEYEETKIIGFVPVEINGYKTEPNIEITTESSEYGPSGGLMVTLAVYDAITEIDITGGLTIVGTGTISLDGEVGSIGGVEYKIKGAVAKKADIFFVPTGENFKEAKKIVERNNYDIILVPVSNFEDALNYLLENVVK